MIRWLAGAKPGTKPDSDPSVTQDPLATLSHHTRHYHVNRLNPLYKEDSSQPVKEQPPSPPLAGQDSPRKSVSSGYESRGNSSSDSGSSTELDQKPKRDKARLESECDKARRDNEPEKTKREKRSNEQPEKPKREKRGKQKKRDKTEELIGNVLAANYSSIKRRSKRSGSPQRSSHLSPIPEGQVDSTIPAPIWPRCTACRIPLPIQCHNGTTDPKNFIHRYNENFPNFRIQFLRDVGEDEPRYEYQHNWEECLRIQIENARKPRSSSSSSTSHSSIERRKRSSRNSEVSQVILQDLANYLTKIVGQKDAVTADEILLAVSESIQRNLEPSSPTVKGEFLLYGSPHREDIYSSSSSSGYKEIYTSSSSSVESVIERLKVYRHHLRHKDDDVYHGDVEKSSEGEGCEKEKKFTHHLRENSSSSIDSSTSVSPASSSASAKVQIPYTEDEIYGIPDSKRTHQPAEQLYELPTTDAKSNRQPTTNENKKDSTLHRVNSCVQPPLKKDHQLFILPPKELKIEVVRDGKESVREAHSAQCGSRAYEKLISAKRKVSDCRGGGDPYDTTPVIPDTATKGVVVQKIEHPYYISMGLPDFTLDVPQAERMMNKISAAKRQRCWCRMTTSMFALVFFMLTVVVVSLVVTKGRRTFGAL